MKKILRYILIPLVLLIIFMCTACNESLIAEEPREIVSENNLSVHYIDVGQGDSTFICLPNGETILIDAGEQDAAEHVIEYIENIGIQRIDYLIGTHPHSDHIGGLSDVINSFEIGKMYMPKVSHTSKTFENLLDAIEENNVDVYSAKAGVVICDEEELTVKMLAPVSEEYEELNDYSAVIKLEYGETSFLFMGDAEKYSENEITESVDVDVLKVGHHGSKSSSSKEFLYSVMPEIAVISVGRDNSYGHPSKPVVRRLEEIGAEVLRTDELGDILIESDGESLYIKEG